jgi:hypothetical protein
MPNKKPTMKDIALATIELGRATIWGPNDEAVYMYTQAQLDLIKAALTK